MKCSLNTVAVLCVLVACGPDANTADERATEGSDTRAQATFDRELSRVRAAADSVDAIFQPLPLLRPAEEAALQRFGNDAQLAAARRSGISPNTDEARLADLVRNNTLVRLADSTELWVVRALDHSAPYMTPAAEALLRELAERFQKELVDLGAPRFRLEITSVLRTAQNQEALRRVNPNAAVGVSTHQYGTTFDIAYNAFAAPAESNIQTVIPEMAWLGGYVEDAERMMLENVGARRSRELMAILGHVLLAMQREGKVMVTLERLQPVYHMTVARERGVRP
jgi:hypothetical protein